MNVKEKMEGGKTRMNERLQGDERVDGLGLCRERDSVSASGHARSFLGGSDSRAPTVATLSKAQSR